MSGIDGTSGNNGWNSPGWADVDAEEDVDLPGWGDWSDDEDGWVGPGDLAANGQEDAEVDDAGGYDPVAFFQGPINHQALQDLVNQVLLQDAAEGNRDAADAADDVDGGFSDTAKGG